MNENICPICKKEIKDDEFFWLCLTEEISRLLERKEVVRKICIEHKESIEKWVDLLSDRERRI